MKIIAGLGNPGKEYEHTRHNMGFDVIDELARRWNVTNWKSDMKAEIAQVIYNGEKVLLVKPMTYMNNSGEAVGAISKYYKVGLDDIYIICDDLDLPPGKTRIRKKGSAGGHNGMKSLIAYLGSENFNRFRIGVGHPKDGHTVVDHVLSRPYGEDIEKGWRGPCHECVQSEKKRIKEEAVSKEAAFFVEEGRNHDRKAHCAGRHRRKRKRDSGKASGAETERCREKGHPYFLPQLRKPFLVPCQNVPSW